jgi:hypothetical protein
MCFGGEYPTWISRLSISGTKTLTREFGPP